MYHQKFNNKRLKLTKNILVIIIVSVFITNLSFSQYKDLNDTEKSSLNESTNKLILGIFNPNNFYMNHSIQVSMCNTEYGYVSVTSYINSMKYKFSDNISISADVKLQYSPFVSSSFGTDFASSLQKDLTGLTLSRLSFDYKISDSAYLRFEFRNFDGSHYNDYYNPFSRYDNLNNSYRY